MSLASGAAISVLLIEDNPGDVRLLREALRDSLRRFEITDLPSLLFRDEEQVLTGQPDAEQYYRDVILPEKLALSLFNEADCHGANRLSAARITSS